MTGKEEGRGCRALCKVVHKSARFWLALSTMATMTVMVGMENYIALWLTDVFRPCTDTEGENCNSVFESGYASIVSSLLPLGLICSLVYGQVFLRDVHPKKDAKITVRFLACATLLVVVFLVWTTLVETGTRPKDNPENWVGGLAVFILLYGFFVGYPYYIPAAVYAVKIGGANSATLSAILDLGGFILLTVFAYLGTALSEAEGVSETAMSTWRYTFYVVGIMSAIATATMFGFQYFNVKALTNTNLQTIVRQSTLEISSKVS